MMETTQNSATTQVYPLYGTHGNMVATLSKNTAGTSWSLGNERSYDVWGSVRSGAVTGGPKGRYVANLGHVADDESGLIYMRARYYEPESGRFVSEDPAKYGSNWYIYANSDSANFVDETGEFPVVAVVFAFVGGVGLGLGFAFGDSLFWGADAGAARQGRTSMSPEGKQHRDEVVSNGVYAAFKGALASALAAGAVGVAGVGTSVIAGGPLLLTFGLSFFIGALFGFYSAFLESLIFEPEDMFE